VDLTAAVSTLHQRRENPAVPQNALEQAGVLIEYPRLTEQASPSETPTAMSQSS
jgi:hypothetical protein